MQTIHKIELMQCPEQQTQLPVGAKILCVKEQYNTIQIWFIKPDTYSLGTEFRAFTMYMTGEYFEEIAGEYIGTVLLNEGSLVYHVFEVKE